MALPVSSILHANGPLGNSYLVGNDHYGKRKVPAIYESEKAKGGQETCVRIITFTAGTLFMVRRRRASLLDTAVETNVSPPSTFYTDHQTPTLADVDLRPMHAGVFVLRQIRLSVLKTELANRVHSLLRKGGLSRLAKEIDRL